MKSDFFKRRLPMAGVLLILGAIIAYGQIIPSWVGSLVSGLDPMTGADPSTPSLTDSVGFKFELYYSAQDASDPQNVTNQVISMDTTGGAIGVALRKLNPGVKITTLTNQLQLK